jgi:hypothetical protein
MSQLHQVLSSSCKHKKIKLLWLLKNRKYIHYHTALCIPYPSQMMKKPNQKKSLEKVSAVLLGSGTKIQIRNSVAVWESITLPEGWNLDAADMV